MQLSQTWIFVLVAAVTGLAVLLVSLGAAPMLAAVLMPALVSAILYAARRDDEDEADSRVPAAERGAQRTGDIPVALGRTLLQQMPSPLLVIARNGRVGYANPAAFAKLAETQIDVHISTLFRAPAFVQAFNGVRSDGQDRSVSFVSLKGQERHYEARLSRLPAGTDFGPDEHIIVQLEDRTRDRLLIQTRSDFVANASHELRTPLASIMGYIETLQNHARDDPEAREKFLGIMSREASRMHRLIDDLMSLSRIEMNAHVRPVEVLDLNAVVCEAASAMEPLARQNDVTLSIELSDEDPRPVRGDRDQLSQVVVNLIDNAVKYGGRGSTVWVKPAAADLRYPNMAGVSVVDTGRGIAKEHIHRLTERFYRVGGGPGKPLGGTGLGLAIVKHILNRHEGSLDVQSVPGKGSTFSVWLPIVTGPISAARTPESQAENVF